MASPILQLQPDAQGWRIRTRDVTLHAAIVVNAAGAWAEEIGILADATDIRLRPLKRTACQQPAEKPPHKRNALNQANDEVHIIKPID